MGRRGAPDSTRPDNPLGTRWIGLDAADVGIHGTNSPWLIGLPVSHGCIRMHNQDIEALYEAVELGSPVFVYGGREKAPELARFWP